MASRVTMNVHLSYALTSRPDANQLLRWWTGFARIALFTTICGCDFVVIVTMSWLTGAAYHLAAYRYAGEVTSFLEVGVLSAIIFIILNLYRGGYGLPNFFAFKPHLHRAVQLWNVTFICLLAAGFLTQISVVYSRAWILLFYVSTICLLLALRYLCVQVIVRASRTGLVSARRIFLVGT